jgi:hypothetical protein
MKRAVQLRDNTAARSPENFSAVSLVRESSHKGFDIASTTVSLFLLAASLFAVYSIGWEFSTQRYLKGFSDAIVPATAPVEEKVEAILAWMVYGPTRLPYQPTAFDHDRDPTDTLNYDALLRVCGTATNAFINLTNASNLQVRRLLLLDSHDMTKHVVAEVLVDGRWIIVDPAYRSVFRDAAGRTLTREELLSPATFNEAIQKIPNYPPQYSFENTVHVRLGGLPLMGRPLKRFLNRVFPGWEDSTVATLLVERESFGAVVASILLVIFFLILRVSLRWYGEVRLRIQLPRFRERILRASTVFLEPTMRQPRQP